MRSENRERNEERKVRISTDLVRIRHGIGTDSVRNRYGTITELLLYNIKNMVKSSLWAIESGSRDTHEGRSE